MESHGALCPLVSSIVQRYAGHADVKTTTRYAWIHDDELKAMAEGFDPIGFKIK